MSETEPKPVLRIDPPREHERRTAGRIHPYWVQCDRGYVLDISADGMKLLTRRPIRKRSIEVRIWDQRHGVTLHASVLWSRRVRFLQHEHGLAFRNLPPEIAQLLARIASELHE